MTASVVKWSEFDSRRIRRTDYATHLSANVGINFGDRSAGVVRSRNRAKEC
jgi:hypothetical protein